MPSEPDAPATNPEASALSAEADQPPGTRGQLSRREFCFYIAAAVAGYFIAVWLYVGHWKFAGQVLPAIAGVVVVLFALTEVETAMDDDRRVKRVRATFACATGGGAVATAFAHYGPDSYLPYWIGGLSLVPIAIFVGLRAWVLGGTPNATDAQPTDSSEEQSASRMGPPS